MIPPGPEILVVVDPRLAERVPRFLERRRADVDDLRAACRRRDFATIERTGHDLKGVGGAYGFDEISAIGHHLEQAAQARDAGAAAIAASTLANYLARVRVRYGRPRAVTAPDVRARPGRANGG